MVEPIVRFKQDDGCNYPALEKKKLGDLTVPISEKNGDRDNYPVYSVNNQAGFIPQDDQFEERKVASKNKSNYRVVGHNQFAYNPSRINVGSIAYLKEDIKVIVSPLYVVFECNDELDIEYLNYYVQTNSFHKRRKINTEGSVRDSLNYEGFSNIEVMLPCIDEQRKVARFLSALDAIIASTEDEINYIEQEKKAVMKKIFSQEIRFRKQDGNPFPEWSNVRFGDIFQEIVKRTSDTKKYPLYSLTIEDGVTAKTDRYERSYLVKKEGDNYKVVPPNAFVYNPMNLRFGALAPNHEKNSVSVSQYYNVFSVSDESTLGFWESYLVSDEMLKYYFTIATGSLIEKLRVHYSNFVNIVRTVPCAEEQRIIASFLSDFDTAIAITKNELELWKKLKKGFLQQMFV